MFHGKSAFKRNIRSALAGPDANVAGAFETGNEICVRDKRSAPGVCSAKTVQGAPLVECQVRALHEAYGGLPGSRGARQEAPCARLLLSPKWLFLGAS
jgi:hypothetical protein